MMDKQPQSPDQQMGRFEADIRWIKEKLTEIDQKIGQTHDTHSESYRQLEERIASLERFKARFYGACGVLTTIAGILYGVLRAFSIV